MKLRLAAVVVLMLSTAIVVSACGSSSSSSSSGGTSGGNGGSTGASEGGAVKPIVTPPPTSPPTEIPIAKPLNEPVPKKTVAWMECELPVCQGGLSRGWNAAAQALGWNLKQITYTALEPQKGIQQALNEKVEGIGITGTSPALFEAQAKQAIKENVPIVSGSDTTEPEPKVNGLYYQGQNAESVKEQTKMVTDWAINDSGGEADIAIVSIEEYPILGIAVEGLKETLKADCPNCGPAGTIAVTGEDLGAGKVPSIIAAYLQAHPEVNYVYFTFSDLSTGVYATLKSLGLIDQVKLIGADGSPANMTEIVKGEAAMWTQQPQEYFMYLEADVLARIFTNTPLEPYEKEGRLPYFAVEKPEAERLLKESEGYWPGPEGYAKHFEELWGS